MGKLRSIALGGIAVLVLVGVGVLGAGMINSGDGSSGDPAEATPTPAQVTPTVTPEPTVTPTPGSTPTPTATPEPAIARFDVSIVESPDGVELGDTATLAVAIENVGTGPGEQAIAVTGGETAQVSLAAGERTEIELAWQPTETGIRNVTVTSANETATTAIEVVDRPAYFAVEIPEEPASVRDREPLTVIANVTNNGTEQATQPLTLTVDGERVASVPVTLDGGESTNQSLTWVPATPHGEYELTVASANDSATTIGEIEPIQEPAVAGTVSVMTEDVPAEEGIVRLYEAGGDDPVASHDLAESAVFRFGNLTPGQEYRLEVPSATGTHPEVGAIGGPEMFPATERTFTAQEVQQSIDPVYGFEIRGADAYRWEFTKQSQQRNRFEGSGRYKDGEAYVISKQIGGSDIARVQQMIYLEDTTFYNTTGRPAPVWYEEKVGFHHPSMIHHQIVQNPLSTMFSRDPEYTGTTVRDGNTVYVYDVSFPDYPDATIYVDRESGYVTGWEADHWRWEADDDEVLDWPATITFHSHGDHSITIEAPR